ncbi:MAG: hypothetical protein M8863_01915 [marine benthic group bacterium]|nr:hypothetical protein [Gemmatimonadota bacterium]
MKRILRWIRGALGNALAWGITWAGFGLLFGAISSISRPYMLPHLPGYALMIGAIGAFFGGSFAAFISVNFRGGSVDELSPGRFAFGGAVVTIPFTLLLNAWVQSWKGWIFLSDMIVPVAVPAVLGGLTAYTTVKLAQRALPELRPTDRLESGICTDPGRLAEAADRTHGRGIGTV